MVAKKMIKKQGWK